MAKPKQKSQPEFKWTPKNVASAKIPNTILRTYWEQRELRALGEDIGPFKTAAEVGAGFGRLTVVLGDYFSQDVTAFERDKDMVEHGKKMQPEIHWHNVSTLIELPAPSKAFEFTMIFTVLQHMNDLDAAMVAGELVRATSKYCLIVEDTDPDYHYVDARTPAHFTNGRSVETYSEFMRPFVLVKQWPRRMEPGFKYKDVPRPFVGTYMLFERPKNGEESSESNQIENAGDSVQQGDES